MAVDPTVLRPLLFNTDGLIGGTISNLRLQNPPNWFNLVQNSRDVVIDNMEMTVFSTGPSHAANTDGYAFSFQFQNPNYF
jgi:galacturan 1,4-alpha-galacturonidase